MTHGSLFAGIKGDQGFDDAGFECKWAVEIEPFCRAVIRTHYPGLPIFEDICGCGAHNLERVDLITAGVPCQDVSVAGKRAGLAGARTGLFFDFARILRELRPAWFVFENVPGLLSSNNGRDFAEVLRVLMVECGYGVCWRVLNSQFFGVAQRRRRVFIVGRFGKPCPPEILFDAESCSGDFAEGEEAREGIAARLTSGSGVTSNAPGRRREDDFNLVWKRRGGFGWSEGEEISPTIESTGGSHEGGSELTPIVAATLPADHRFTTDSCVDNLQPVAAITASAGHHGHDGGFRTEPGEHIVIQDVRGMRDKKQNGIGIDCGGPSYTLDKTSQHAVAYQSTAGTLGARNGGGCTTELDRQGAYVGAAPNADRVRNFAGLPEGLDDRCPLLEDWAPRDTERWKRLDRYRRKLDSTEDYEMRTMQVGRWIGRILKCSS